MDKVVDSRYAYGFQDGAWLVCLFDTYENGKVTQFIQEKYDNEEKASLRAYELEEVRAGRG